MTFVTIDLHLKAILKEKKSELWTERHSSWQQAKHADLILTYSRL